jgi:hypothetical protein
MRRYDLVAALFLLVFNLCTPERGQAGCAPLCCGDFSVMVKGGIAPALVTDRGPNWIVTPGGDPIVTESSDTVAFGRAFHLPWTVGAELGYNLTPKIQTFLEYGYTQAKGKFYQVNPFSANTFSDYKTHAGYLGVRYYFNRCCGSIAPYIGFKTGIAWQDGVTTILTIGGVFIFTPVYSMPQAAISSGLQLGGEWWFSRCWSLVLQGEFIATQGPRTNPNVVFPDLGPGGPTNAVVGTLGWVITFPVTLGLRWTF